MAIVSNFKPNFKSNFRQTPAKILIDLVNDSNVATSLNLAETAVTFGAPSVGVGTPETTLITASATTGSGYRGSVELQYNRVNLGFMATLAPSLVIETSVTNLQELAEYLNGVYGIQLDASDLVSTPVAGLQPDVNTPFNFVAEAASKIWFGAVALNLTATLITLADVVPVTTLDGLYAPTELGE